jgi:dipeptidase E
MNRLILTSQAWKSLIKFRTILKKGMKVAFIATAADLYKDKSFVEKDKRRLIQMGLKIVDYDLKRKNKTKLFSDLEKLEIIFFSGGNTFYLLEKMQDSGFDKVLRKLLSRGIIYIGSSAGSAVVGPSIEPITSLDDPAMAKRLKSFKSLGLVDFVILPHSDNKKYYFRIKKAIKDYSDKFKIVSLKDSQAILVEGNKHIIL